MAAFGAIAYQQPTQPHRQADGPFGPPQNLSRYFRAMQIKLQQDHAYAPPQNRRQMPGGPDDAEVSFRQARFTQRRYKLPLGSFFSKNQALSQKGMDETQQEAKKGGDQVKDRHGQRGMFSL